ncbi:hypothetical protein OIE66_08175 [Nonomuraea sp. NBC_01738]|uniref:Clp protease N-terminal domain-containing protein n=1 Tax=Nonomuraea sp. NBC_01738 TaxID=2976003 RepID=UPI002E0F024F|nr:hypothetical protein OIE66_08175 [Nonomuraea sp. NBC_01738]
MLERFDEAARRAFARAGELALEAGRPELDTDLLLLALAETRPFRLETFTATPEALRGRMAVRDTRGLLRTLGVDLDEVRRAAPGVLGPWRMERFLLRVTLYGPRGQVALAMHTRKVVEVALYGRRAGVVTGEGLVRGLLADRRNGAVGHLRATGVNVGALAGEAGMRS